MLGIITAKFHYLKRFFPIAIAAILSAAPSVGAPMPDEIPFELVHGFGLVAHGGIGSLNDLAFLVDTGAVPSVLSQRIAVQIGVLARGNSFALLHKDTEAQYVTVDEVRFGWVRAIGFPMVVVDLARLERLLGTRIDAIIGLDMLLRQNFSIDYQRRRITRGLSGLPYMVPAEIYTAAGTPYWVLSITLGGHPFRMLLDTGANDFALFAGHVPKPELGLRWETTLSASLTGQAAVQYLQPLRLAMGNMPPRNQQAVVLEQPPGALPKIDGVLGPAALRISRIELDWDHKSVLWDTE